MLFTAKHYYQVASWLLNLGFKNTNITFLILNKYLYFWATCKFTYNKTQDRLDPNLENYLSLVNPFIFNILLILFISVCLF